MPVAVVRHLFPVAADQEDRVVGPDPEHHDHEEGLQGGGDLPAGGSQEAEHAQRDHEGDADRGQRDEGGEGRPVDRQQHEDDEDDRDRRGGVRADLDRLEVVGADGRGARHVGLQASGCGIGEVLAEKLDDGLGIVAGVRDVEVDREQLERAVGPPEQLLQLGTRVCGRGVRDRRAESLGRRVAHDPGGVRVPPGQVLIGQPARAVHRDGRRRRGRAPGEGSLDGVLGDARWRVRWQEGGLVRRSLTRQARGGHGHEHRPHDPGDEDQEPEPVGPGAQELEHQLPPRVGALRADPALNVRKGCCGA